MDVGNCLGHYAMVWMKISSNWFGGKQNIYQVYKFYLNKKNFPNF